ncbi:MAG TPA: hypothetical protein VF622_16395 [Segetibacter sp.]
MKPLEQHKIAAIEHTNDTRVVVSSSPKETKPKYINTGAINIKNPRKMRRFLEM